MSAVERLYTIEEIAKMTSLTMKTIQNHLRQGTLRGRKIGGQWRFTATDIREMINSGEIAFETEKEQKRTVIDFMDGVNTDSMDEIQICTVIDLFISKEAAKDKNSLLRECVDSAKSKTHISLQYHYNDAEQKARFLLFAPPEIVGKVMEILK